MSIYNNPSVLSCLFEFELFPCGANQIGIAINPRKKIKRIQSPFPFSFDFIELTIHIIHGTSKNKDVKLIALNLSSKRITPNNIIRTLMP